jgi:hypothetical protein
MKPDFHSAKVLLTMAEVHIGEFERVALAYVNGRPYTLFTEVDPKSGNTLFKAKIAHEPPKILSAHAFVILSCLRSSLDHAVYDSARILGGHPKPESTKFPFGPTRRQAKKDLEKKKSQVPPELARFLLKLKPYKRGNRALWAMNQLRNQKIHRTLSVMAIANRGIGFGVGHIGLLEAFSVSSRWNSRKMELTYMAAAKAEDININIHIQPLVILGYGTPLAGKPAVPALKQLLGVAVGIVLGIEAETPRLTRGKL